MQQHAALPSNTGLLEIKNIGLFKTAAGAVFYIFMINNYKTGTYIANNKVSG